MSGGRVLRQEVICMVQDDGPVGLDRVRVLFDDGRAVADAGIVLPVTLAARLGIAACVSGRARGRPTRGGR